MAFPRWDRPPPEAVQPLSPEPPPRWILAIALVVFVGFAINFLYVFVDDEGIPYVFARNLLRGRGLAYNSLEGLVEGYSDFLHVWFAAGLIAVVQACGLDVLSVFLIDKACSFLAGTMVVVATFVAMRRIGGIPASAALGGLLFLALAGPLAMWSCSSLEASFFGLLATLLICTLLTPGAEPGAAVVVVAMFLDRIDGFVYAGAVLAGFLVVGSAARRREILRRIVLPAALVFTGYHAWRVWYFGEVLPSPLAAKVLYKLTPGRIVVERRPPAGYVTAFTRLYGLVPLLVAVVLVAYTARQRRIAAAFAIAVALQALYLSIVGDWMAGFRFFVPVLPAAALCLSLALAVLHVRSRNLARTAAGVLVLWAAMVAGRFAQTFDSLQYRESWYRSPSFDARRYFGPYFPLVEASAALLKPGDRIAYNQAGFVPFVLDLDNIDNLGICSKFFAHAPTTDVIFTEVGRYSPLTNSAALRTSDAYLLYREPKAVIVRMDNLRRANSGAVPNEILWGRYRRIATDSAQENVIYGRTALPVDMFRREPWRFLENVAHVSHLQRASVNGRLVPRDEYLEEFPFLQDRRHTLAVDGAVEFDFQFAGADVDVYELHASSVQSDLPVVAVLTLWSAGGQPVHREEVMVGAQDTRRIARYFDRALRAARLTVSVKGSDERTATVRVTDVRVQGQPPALARFIARNVKFEQPPNRPGQ